MCPHDIIGVELFEGDTVVDTETQKIGKVCQVDRDICCMTVDLGEDGYLLSETSRFQKVS